VQSNIFCIVSLTESWLETFFKSWSTDAHTH